MDNTTSHARNNHDPSIPEIARTLRLFVAPGDVGEIRVIGRGAPFGIYFDDDQIDEAANLAVGITGARGVYLVMNRLDSALGTRPKLTDSNVLTKDADIVRRCWLLIDFDPSSPERGANESATDAEKEAARERMEVCYEWLGERGFPEPVFADSGNGWHLLFRIDLPNDEDSGRLVKAFLHALSKRFSDDHVGVDISVHNASRITKLYGTPARKGDDRPDRPHRLSKLLSVPDGGAGIVAREFLESVIADGNLFNQPTTSNAEVQANNRGDFQPTPKSVRAAATNSFRRGQHEQATDLPRLPLAPCRGCYPPPPPLGSPFQSLSPDV